ncbi:hypothetical protein EO98_17775 [Methanosarcina sp. 2.H.T.1A.6]|nr:hypothetical protein EO97_19020 [Methanosarcina sp. 2.H.T.1A.15]KKG15712.1 hypothetical protein EO94_01485 [Methanosarcina sp. 2.H.T.1A.3]KKG24595.1 hypothetical protein EO98_17775 [Methanosarcina sp. 2.H.T.1A.6]KKG25807.1 hypothetical protein EO96_19465 [Methanosarcina sp. 2.H.T.1A.8]
MSVISFIKPLFSVPVAVCRRTSIEFPVAYPVIFEGRASVELYRKLKGKLLKIVIHGLRILPDGFNYLVQLHFFLVLPLQGGSPEGLKIS